MLVVSENMALIRKIDQKAALGRLSENVGVM
jgi:hypothetical protein